MKKGLALKVAAMVVPFLVAGCGGGDNIFGNPDAGTTDGPANACPGVTTLYAVGSGDYMIVDFSIVSDGCMIMPDPTTIKGTTRTVTYDSAKGTLTVAGAQQGSPDLGTGPVRCNTGTLTLGPEQATGDGGCTYTLQRSSTVTLVANSDFKLDYTESQTTHNQACMPSTDCTSHFVWEFKR